MGGMETGMDLDHRISQTQRVLLVIKELLLLDGEEVRVLSVGDSRSFFSNGKLINWDVNLTLEKEETEEIDIDIERVLIISSLNRCLSFILFLPLFLGVICSPEREPILKWSIFYK